MNLTDARTWFRYRSKMTKRVKGNTSSAFRNNMNFRHCNQKIKEAQEHLEVCEATKEIRVNLDLTKKELTRDILQKTIQEARQNNQ